MEKEWFLKNFFKNYYYWKRNGFQWDDTGCRSECSWFGFMIRVREEAPFNVSQMASFLDKKKIGNRMLFGGNLLRQPALIYFKKNQPKALRVVGALNGADLLMKQAIFLGTYPGLSQEMLEYVIEIIHNFVKNFKGTSDNKINHGNMKDKVT